jgi:ABC-type nitrate/sulfonate/bicarbonate transport system substrate-binding protein
VARAAGLLDPIEARYDVKIVFHSFSYGAPENQAMAAGDLDLASAGMGPAIVAAARLPAKLLGISILEQTAIIVPSDSPITAVAQLKGKRIAYPGQGSQQYPLLLKALKAAGLEEGDVELFKTKGSDVATLVESGGVDAGITWDPHVSRALASGKAKVLMKAEAILPLKSGHYIGNGVYGRTEFIDANPALVEDIMLAIIKAERLIIAEPDTAVDMWSKQIGFPREVIDYALKEGISVYDEDVAATPEMIEKYVGFLKEAGILKPEDSPKLAPEFAQRALKRLQAE